MSTNSEGHFQNNYFIDLYLDSYNPVHELQQNLIVLGKIKCLFLKRGSHNVDMCNFLSNSTNGLDPPNHRYRIGDSYQF